MTNAQEVTKLCYDEETRNLNFKVGCKNVEDFKECIEIIRSYNEFDSKRINKAVDKYFPQSDTMTESTHFTIGREGSPVIYLGRYLGNDESFFAKCREFATEVGADEMDKDNDNEFRIWFD